MRLRTLILKNAINYSNIDQNTQNYVKQLSKICSISLEILTINIKEMQKLKKLSRKILGSKI